MTHVLQTTSERSLFHKEMAGIRDAKFMQQWKKVMPGLIWPGTLRQRFRTSYAAYSNLNPALLPMPEKPKNRKRSLGSKKAATAAA